MTPRCLAQPCPPPLLLVECMMPRCLTPPCSLSPSFLPPHAVVRELGLLLEFTFEVGRGVECMMPRRLARPCPLPLYSRHAHAVMYWFVLGPLEPTFENGHGVELYDADATGTAIPALPPRSPCTRCCVRNIPSRYYV